MTTRHDRIAELLDRADELRGKSLELTTLRKLAAAVRESGDPPEGTPERDLWEAAIDVARDAPRRRGTYVSHAKVYWPHIDRLRDALAAVGINWRVIKTEQEARRG